MLTEKLLTMKATIELLNLAKEKAVSYFKNSKAKNMLSIRLTAEEESYTIFYQNGIAYLGSYEREELPKFFPNRIEYDLTDEKGDILAKMQKLMRV
jgi:hypothetical protein